MSTLQCEFCGSPLASEKKSPVVKCQYCGRDNYFELNATDLQAKTIDDYYALIQDAARFNSLKDLSTLATEVLKMDDNDAVGKYFKSYTHYRQSGNDDLQVFFMSAMGMLKKNQLFIVDHMSDFLDLKYRPNVENYLKSAAPQLVNTYKSSQTNRVQTEDNYAKIQRDVFVCFSSKDHYLADIVMNELEKESFSCWISTRNLRKNSPESYWTDIEDAIQLSRVCLVIGSENSMLSKDVQREIKIAQTHHVKLVELKVDESTHNVFFKHAFDGNRWVDGFNDFNQGLNHLKTRIFQEISFIKNQGDPTIQRVAQVQARTIEAMQTSKEKFLSTKILLSLMLLIFVSQIVFLFFVFRDYFLTHTPNVWQLFF